MVFTHGFFAAVGIVAFPLSIMFGLFVYWNLQEILRRLPRLDLPSFLALAGIFLFFAECLLFVQFWRLARNHLSLQRPALLWAFSIVVFLSWIAWFYAGAVTVRWHQSPDFPMLSLLFVMWPFTGFVLSSIALHVRLRRVSPSAAANRWLL